MRKQITIIGDNIYPNADPPSETAAETDTSAMTAQSAAFLDGICCYALV